MHAILLNTTAGEAHSFLMGLSPRATYAKWIDELIDAYSCDLSWQLWFMQHLQSATTLGDLALRMQILRSATTNVRFEEFALLMEKSNTFPQDWELWKSVGRNMLLHDAYEALQDRGCTQKAMRTYPVRSATSSETKPAPSNRNRNRNRGRNKSKSVAPPDLPESVQLEAEMANASTATGTTIVYVGTLASRVDFPSDIFDF